MPKMTRRQMPLAYYAKCVQEWRAQGKPAAVINRMLVCALEMTRSCHPNPASDAGLVFEIADGVRCA